MQKPDFEIVIKCVPWGNNKLLISAAATDILARGATYIKYEGESESEVNLHVQGWREQPEGWEKE